MAIDVDHEFPWIEIDWSEQKLRCTVCGAIGDLGAWISWIEIHAQCKKKEIRDIGANEK